MMSLALNIHAKQTAIRDMSDDEWSLLEPMVPAARSGGRPRTTDMREVVNAIFYIESTGCQWRALPKDFPPMTLCRGNIQDS